MSGGRRNRTRIAIGAVIIVVSVLGSIALYTDAAQRRSVLQVARRVAIGQQIRASDLASVEIGGGTTVATVAATNLGHVVGQVAAVELIPGSLLARGQFRGGPAIEPDTATTGALLKAGQYPIGLSRGDVVRVIETNEGGNSDSQNAAQDRGTATVVDVSPEADGSLSVSLSVPIDAARDIAAAGAASHVSLVVVGGS